jgi:hypothetical protein
MRSKLIVSNPLAAPARYRRQLLCGAGAAAVAGLAGGLYGCGGGFIGINFGGPGFGIGLGVVVDPDDDHPPAGRVLRDSGAASFAGGVTVLGDGLAVVPPDPPVTNQDIQTLHTSSQTVLTANSFARAVQAHNITYIPVTDTQAMQSAHVASYEFRLPQLPTAPGATLRPETVEGGLFIWDGANTRLDHGAAFQWRVNPASPDYGKLYTWRADGVNRFWVEIGRIEPDTNWHSLRLEIDPRVRRAAIAVDGIVDSLAYAQEAKPGFGDDTTARLQIETINALPSPGVAGWRGDAEFRNWRWQWVR